MWFWLTLDFSLDNDVPIHESCLGISMAIFLGDLSYCIASAKHSRSWENSRKLCKSSTTSIVCQTVSKILLTIVVFRWANMLNAEKALYCLINCSVLHSVKQCLFSALEICSKLDSESLLLCGEGRTSLDDKGLVCYYSIKVYRVFLICD